MSTPLTPIRGPGGVVKFRPDPAIGIQQRDKAIAALQVEILRARAANTHLKDQLTSSRDEISDLKREIRGLRAALSSSLSGPAEKRWRAVICDDCGCLCKPHEACPMCLWISAQDRERKAA